MRILSAVMLCGGVLLLLPLGAQSFAPPVAGFVADRNGHPQRIFGIAGNLLPEMLPDGGAARERALSLAFTGWGGLVKTESTVILLDATGTEMARFDAPGGPAVFGFDPSGRPALVWLPGTQELFAVSPAGLAPLSSPSDRIAALALGDAGDVKAVPDGPALFVPGGVLSASGPDLVFHHQDGSEESIGVPGPVERLERMGDGWVAVETAGERYALRLAAPLRLYQIPEVTG